MIDFQEALPPSVKARQTTAACKCKYPILEKFKFIKRKDMTKALLLASTYISCLASMEIEIGGKLYSYDPVSKQEITLETKDSTYKCHHDRPFKIGPGIKTLSRYRCGPIIVFTQIFLERCNRFDYNPHPDDFHRSTDYGRNLLSIQHDCMEDGLKMTDSWTKLRDRSGEEWQLNKSYKSPHSGKLREMLSSKCSTREKIDKRIDTYEIKETKDILRLIETRTSPVKSIRNKRKPLL